MTQKSGICAPPPPSTVGEITYGLNQISGAITCKNVNTGQFVSVNVVAGTRLLDGKVAGLSVRSKDTIVISGSVRSFAP